MKKSSDPTDDNLYFRLFFRDNCKPPTALPEMIFLLLLILLIILKILWFQREWADPHLVDYAYTILRCTAKVVEILLFLHQHIPKRMLKIGSAKDHLISMWFDRGYIKEIYLRKKSCQVVTFRRIRVYYKKSSKDKTRLKINMRFSTTHHVFILSINGRKKITFVHIVTFVIKCILRLVEGFSS